MFGRHRSNSGVIRAFGAAPLIAAFPYTAFPQEALAAGTAAWTVADVSGDVSYELETLGNDDEIEVASEPYDTSDRWTYSGDPTSNGDSD